MKFQLAITAGILLAAAASAKDPAVSPAAAKEDLWTHIKNVAELGEVRGASVEFIGQGTGRVLRIEVGPTNQCTYAWVTVPAPKAGWNLATRKTVEAGITNDGETPIEVMLWVVGSHGWDAVEDTGKLAPRESRNFVCHLRAVFPDRTPKIDPTQVKCVQVMVCWPKPGMTVEVSKLVAAGEAPAWKRPASRLDVPEMEDGPPAAGRRVRYRFAGEGNLYGVLYLPEDWKAGGSYPVIVEYPGNRYFDPACYSIGRPEQCVIGYGMTKGRGAIWVSLPFVDRKNGTIVEAGMGDGDATAEYAMQAVDEICRKFGGDRKNLVLTGFSRGAIACGVIGLHNDRIAALWKGLHITQHYDGDAKNGSGLPGAIERARRFAGRSIFITDNAPSDTLRQIMAAARTEVIYAQSGLHAHACAMFLDDRPSTQQLREWFRTLVGER